MTLPAEPQPVDPDRRHRPRVDLTINIPTVIMIATLIVSTSAWAMGIYTDIDKRQTISDIAITALAQRVDRVEASVNGVKAEQGLATNTLRQDMKTEMADIKQKLDRILFSGPSTVSQRQLKEWSKD